MELWNRRKQIFIKLGEIHDLPGEFLFECQFGDQPQNSFDDMNQDIMGQGGTGESNACENKYYNI